MFSVLKTNWKIQLGILWLGQAVLIAMLTMSLPYWPLYISELGHFSPLEIRFWGTAMYLAPFLASIFSSPLWGKLGDQLGYKEMIVYSCAGLWMTQVIFLICTNLYIIFLIRLIQGILLGFIVVAQSYALIISPKDLRGSTIGQLQSATAVGNLIGPLLGGVIAWLGGYLAIFTSSTFILSLITLLFLGFLNTVEKPAVKLNTLKKTQNRSSFLQQTILVLLSLIVTIQLARAMVIPIFALFVTEKLGGNDITIGILYAATGLMIFATAPFWGQFFDNMIRSGFSVYPIMITLLLISAILQLLHAYAHTTFLICILRLLWGICLGALLPLLLRLLVDQNDTDENGIYLGLGNSATKIGNLLGIVIGALIEAHFGFKNSFLLTSLLYVVASIIVIIHLYYNKCSFVEKTHES